MERPSLISSQDRDAAVTLAKGPRQELWDFTQPGFHGGATAQHLPTKWAPAPSRGAHKMEIMVWDIPSQHISPYLNVTEATAEAGEWWTWITESCFTAPVFCEPNNQVDQICLISLTRVLFSLGVVIYTPSCSGLWVADKVSQRWVRLLSL